MQRDHVVSAMHMDRVDVLEAHRRRNYGVSSRRRGGLPERSNKKRSIV
jgi:hypothetical protein